MSEQHTITNRSSTHTLQAILQPIFKEEIQDEEASQDANQSDQPFSLHNDSLILSFSSQVKPKGNKSSVSDSLTSEEITGSGIAKVVKGLIQKVGEQQEMPEKGSRTHETFSFSLSHRIFII